MDSLQSGLSNQQLSPQAFKNSNQESGIQTTIDDTSLQGSGSSSINLYTTPSQGSLKVIAGPNQQNVLGLSSLKQSQSNQQSTTYATQNGGLTFVLLPIIVVSLYFSTFFYKKFKNSPVPSKPSENS